MTIREVVKFEYNNREIIKRLSEAMGVTKDIDLAEAIGESQSKVASWKRIKSPPALSCFEVAMHTGKSIEWLLLGTDTLSESGQETLSVQATPPETQNTKAAFSHLFLKAMRTAIDSETLYRGNDVSDSEIKRLGTMLYNDIYHAEQQSTITKEAFAHQFFTLLQKALKAGTFERGKEVSNAELKRNGVMFYHTWQDNELSEKNTPQSEQV